MGRKKDLFGSKPQMNEFDRKYSLILAKAIQKNNLTKRKISLRKWMPHFKKLRIDDGIEKERIKEVLLWYIEHIKDRYTPKAYSADGFRGKFFQIEDAMVQDEDEQEKEDDFKRTVIEETEDGGIVEIDYSS